MGGGPWETWPLEGAPATGHWVRSALPGSEQLPLDRQRGRQQEDQTLCLDHTLGVRKLGPTPGMFPTPVQPHPPHLSFPIYKTGLISPFPGLYGDPCEVINRRGEG